jgi:hypothetical protein
MPPDVFNIWLRNAAPAPSEPIVALPAPAGPGPEPAGVAAGLDLTLVD